MRILIFIFCLFLSVEVFSQEKNAIGKDSASIPHSKFIPRKPLIVVDGAVYNADSLKNINVNDIFEIDTLKYKYNKNSSINRVDSITILITTKKGAVYVYQHKFGGFSKGYKDYLEHHQNNDGDFLYLLDGIPAEQNNIIGIRKLYEIKAESIDKVIFKEKYSDINNVKPIIIITTKQ